jgi:hypothetical protein
MQPYKSCSNEWSLLLFLLESSYLYDCFDQWQIDAMSDLGTIFKWLAAATS